MQTEHQAFPWKAFLQLNLDILNQRQISGVFVWLFCKKFHLFRDPPSPEMLSCESVASDLLSQPELLTQTWKVLTSQVLWKCSEIALNGARKTQLPHHTAFTEFLSRLISTLPFSFISKRFLTYPALAWGTYLMISKNQYGSNEFKQKFRVLSPTNSLPQVTICERNRFFENFSSRF
jgi:hypothetical protein